MNARELFLRHLAQTSPDPMLLEVEEAEGIYIRDSTGKDYMDLISGISVSNVGHCHPKVVKAIRKQSKRYMHAMVYGEFIQSPQLRLAGFLTERLPTNLQSVYFVNSGTEAVEGALKVAKKYTGRANTVSCINAYHGSTAGSLSIMGGDTWKDGYRPLVPGNRLIRYNNRADLDFIDVNTACVVMEVVQAEAGVILPEPGYLEAVRARCTETGTLLIFDEIQTGCGRTGTLFGFESAGVVPDIITLAKGLGGGLPLGAFISSPEIMSVITFNPPLGHITTFGGNAVCCAAALASLKVIVKEELFRNAGKEALFVSLLKHHAIREVSHKGLMLAVHLDSFENVLEVTRVCLREGLITDWFLFADHCIRIAPPLIITENEIRQACEIITHALNEVYGT